MDKSLNLNNIYDFYSELLTAFQREVFEMYYHEDLSLTEIADQNGTSKQAVSILLRRTETKLLHYESKLGLLEQHRNTNAAIIELEELINTFAGNGKLERESAATLKKVISEWHSKV